jgi:AcrR family transcriptional regulator
MPATMAAPPKKPRRTAERILEVTLDLFNRFGEPNVSTTLISAELNISPGNLYYHYPAKDELINALFDRYERALDELLQAADNVANVEDAWLFFHMLFELICTASSTATSTTCSARTGAWRRTSSSC